MASSSSIGRGRQSSPIRILQGRAANYNNKWLTKDQWAWAKDGIKSMYHVTCKEGNHFSFNLVPAYRQEDHFLEPQKSKVWIGPEGSKYEYPTCTCPAFVDSQRACRHIFWVLDNLLNYRDEETDGPDRSLPLRYDGHGLRSHTAPYYQIRAAGLAELAHANDWVFSGSGDWGKPAQTRDMLQHLDGVVDYPSSQYTDDYLSTSPSLRGAVYRLAISKPRFFADLREEPAIDPSTKSYFRRLGRQIDDTFRRWINYTKTGQPRLDYRDDDTHPDNITAPNVVWVSNRLRRYVYDIENAIWQREELSEDTQLRAFGLLMTMLDTVIEMDLEIPDIHYRPRHVEVFGETAREGNLFTRLIRTYSEDYNHFAISAMRRIPRAGKDYLPRLVSYRQTIHQSASEQFANEFDTLIYDIERS
ncbi:hypothetical protein H072_3293 [Dactylellina haptotyla CBS 200.50]|uniref:SWIM-type domain-containing protein n=1 Tax=Dactylellina haptotyla (strain CBS 200.50) TaxID=1284197 RepID=S8AI40_DACHA|nr:hypothetical protein H072_3293 [Dactylellina haptotyla CBS 200.50]